MSFSRYIKIAKISMDFIILPLLKNQTNLEKNILGITIINYCNA